VGAEKQQNKKFVEEIELKILDQENFQPEKESKKQKKLSKKS